MAKYYNELDVADAADIIDTSITTVGKVVTKDARESLQIPVKTFGERTTPAAYSTVKAFKSTPQIIGVNTQTIVTFDITNNPYGVDVGNEWTYTGTDSYFAPTGTGWYWVHGRITFDNAGWNVGDGARLRFVKGTNMADTILDQNDTHGATAVHINSKELSSFAYLITGNQYRWYMFISSPAASKTVNGDAIGQYTYSNIYRLF